MMNFGSDMSLLLTNFFKESLPFRVVVLLKAGDEGKEG
jgi:hypothetical protein